MKKFLFIFVMLSSLIITARTIRFEGTCGVVENVEFSNNATNAQIAEAYRVWNLYKCGVWVKKVRIVSIDVG